MLDIVFVILNYNIVSETVNCITSIVNNCDTNDYKIIVVDNGSNRGIVDSLKNHLENYKSIVEIIELNENIGFANGNNKGIEQAMRYSPKFVCCMNNDTELIQKNFYQTLSERYMENHAAIIGPKVFLKDGSIQRFNPFLKNVDYYKEELKGYESAVSNNWKNKLKNQIKNIDLLYKLLKRKPKSILGSHINYNEEMYDVIIHGCCVIFTPTFFKHLSGFDNRTFLYREEELLYIMVKNHDLHSCYCPSLFIKHLEDVSTNTINKSRSDRDRFYCSNQIKSLRIVISELEN